MVNPMRHICRAGALALCLLLPGCYGMRSSDGGAQATAPEERIVDPADVAVPRGYRIEVVATGLNFPSGVAFDDAGTPHVVEAGYSYGEVWTTPRLLRIEPDGATSEIARGDNPPWNGVTFYGGAFYVAEGGHKRGGRILRITTGGETEVLVDELPSVGDHHTNGPVFGPDGALYFGQGTATNSGVVGKDNADFGWLARHPQFHDIPAEDITLAGHNFSGPDALDESDETVMTGAFLPYGVASDPGQVIPGSVPCTGAILRLADPGAELEVVAWGLRNPFGLAFGADGRLYVSDNSYDERGSRPVWGAGDLLWAIDTTAPALWHGWPDFHGDRPLTDGDRYGPRGGGDDPEFLLAAHPNQPPRPVAVLGVHGSANGMDFSTSSAFGHEGDLFIALFGDMAPPVGKTLAPVGFKVVRVNVETGVIEEFAVNRAGAGPASKAGGAGLERPVAARFSPDGSALYIVDFGILTSDKEGHAPRPETGALWRITREGAP